MSLRSEEKRRERLALRYGLSVDQWDALLVEQGGRCALCLEPNPDLAVDHCHKTGNVRGLLCRFCNRAISLWGDDLAGAERLVTYMRRGG